MSDRDFFMADSDGNEFYEDEIRRVYDEMLDDCYPVVNIAGCEYDPSYALKEIDPIAYRVGFHDYCSSLIDDGWTEGDRF